MICMATETVLTSHKCSCNQQRGHNADGTESGAWHVCGTCGSIWTDEKEVEIPGGAKVIQLRRVPTGVAYAPGSVEVPLDGTEVRAELTAGSPTPDVCPACGQGGVMTQGEFGIFVHDECRPQLMMAAEVARTHVNAILELAGYAEAHLEGRLHTIRPAPYAYATRWILKIARGQ